MTKLDISATDLLQGSAGLAVTSLLPGTTPFANAATMEESIIAAAEAAGPAAVTA